LPDYPLILGTSLDTAVEDRRVSERIAPLEWVLADPDTFWCDACHRQVVDRLQDRTHHIEEVVEGCQRALTTMFSVMLPWNPFPEKFHQLLDTFRSSDRIHNLIRLNLVAGANFALSWIWNCKPETDFEVISWRFPPHRSRGVLMRAHVNATLEPAKRMINRLLEADARFFQEHHYLHPLLSGPTE
jgi:hypothetical protein